VSGASRVAPGDVSAANRRAVGGAAAPAVPRWLPAVAGSLVVLSLVSGGILWARKKPEPVEVEDPQAKYGAYLVSYPFGGRSASWWAERLTELSPTGKIPDAKLLELTIARAKSNGLVVEAQGNGYSVMPNAELSKRILDRLEVK
jgi:hypothetical protein